MNDIERQLAAAAAHADSLGGSDGPVEPTRLAENLLAIQTELDAPRESRLARLLRRLGVPDLSIPLVTATPALRRSWFLAILIAVFFAFTATTNQTTTGVDRIAVFLTLAPLLPLLGVALAFGKGVDPTHDIVVAAPRDTFTVFLIRALTVLTASSTILLISSMLLPEGGAYRLAWLLPALAIASVTLVLASRYDPRRVAAILAAVWVVTVVIATSSTSVVAMFGPVTQVISLVVAAVAGALLFASRERFETVGQRSKGPTS